MFYLLLVVVAALGVALYLLFIFQLVPGAMEERLGVFEPLPDDVGKWRRDEQSADAQAAHARGRRREERVCFEESHGLLSQGGRLLRQVRYRDATSNEIVEILPNERLKRRRVRS